MVAQACHPGTWEVETEGSNCHGSWEYIVRTACGDGEKAGSGKSLPQKHKGLNWFLGTCALKKKKKKAMARYKLGEIRPGGFLELPYQPV